MPKLVDDQLFGETPQVFDADLKKDALRSKQFATVVDLLGYGEIEGILDEGGDGTDTFRKNVFLDKTPLLNAVGIENFQDVTVEQRTGLSEQLPVQMVNATEINLGGQFPKEIKNSAPVTETITNTSIDKIRVTVQIPQLQKFNDDGGVSKTSVQITIRITQQDGTIATPVNSDVIEGKVSNNFLKDYEIKFPQVITTNDDGTKSTNVNLSFPISVTVIRETVDNLDDDKLRNKTFLAGITQIISETNNYNNFAYVATRFNAETFRSYPRRMFRVKGTKIRIPAPYTADGVTLTPQADTNNGRIIYPDGYIFQGVLTTTKVWSSDPAFVLFDLLTTDKGFGGPDGIIKEENLDLFSFFEASKYSSALITDPITQTEEPRFSTNIILNQRRDAYTLISDLCSVMRAEAFYTNGSLSIVQDRPTNIATNTSDPQYIFNNSNISEQGFTYSTVGQKTKFTEVEVSYFNNDTQDLDFEYVSADQIDALSGYTSKFGNIRKTLKTFACTSRGQANRFGRWFLYTNLKETQICSFTATLEAGVYIRPSTIIGIADSLKAGIRRGGRINSVNDSQGDENIDQIIVDDENNTDLTDINNAKLSVVLPNPKEIDASTKQTTMIETRDISDITGRTITVTSPFSVAPQVNSVWAIENTDVEFQTYRVISVEEENHCEYKITAIIHDTNKYAQVEDPEIAANPRNIRTLIDEKPSPSFLEAKERIIVLNDRAVSVVDVTWQPVQGVKNYYLEFEGPNDNPQTLIVADTNFQLKESDLGQYTFRVKSINALGVMSSTTTTVSIKTFGKTALPNNVQNLGIETISDKLVRLRFDQSTDVDVLHGGTVVIRATNINDGTGSFSNSTTIKEVSGNSTEAEVPNITSGEYILKFKDDGGRLSAGETSVIYNNSDPLPIVVASDNREDTQSTPFSGTKTNCSFDSSKNGLTLDEFSSNQQTLTGEYFFAAALDFGSKTFVNLKRHLITEAYYRNTFDSRTALIDTWTSFDQTDAFDVDATLFVATSDGDPAISDNATYSNGASGDHPQGITIRRNNHGLKQGDMIYINFTNGPLQNNTSLGGSDRQYQVVFIDDDKFFVTIFNQLNVNGDCTISKAFTRFNTFVNGTFNARAFKFKLQMKSNDPVQSIVIKELGYSAEMEPRTETNVEKLTTSSTEDTEITFTKPFFAGDASLDIGADLKPYVEVIVLNLQDEEYLSITDITITGFKINVFKKIGLSSATDERRARDFNFVAIGYG
tara:strand:- start:181 stop:3897 length:3717 start_codon:yes stop_codon:yes gene_type:complete